MTLSLFGLFNAGRRNFLQALMFLPMQKSGKTFATNVPYLYLNGYKFDRPKFKLGDRVGYRWFSDDRNLETQELYCIEVYQEGLIIGYFPNCQPLNNYQEKYAGQWCYCVYWLMSSLNSERELGFDLDCQYFEHELTLV